MEAKGQTDISSFSWTSQKGLLTIGSFTVIALVCEFFIVTFFAGSGLAELSADLLAASMLYVFLPLVVITVLVSSWIYLTKHVLVGPRIVSSVKKSKIHRRHSRRRKQKSFTQNTFESINKAFSKISAAFSGSSSAKQSRLTLNKAALESTITIVTIFLLAAFLLSVLVYPRLFTDFATGFYSTQSPLQDFMKGLADALVPIASGLDSIAPAVRDLFGGLATASVQSMTETDILLRYVLCQNAAAWISGLSVFAYVKYFSKTYRVTK